MYEADPARHISRLHVRSLEECGTMSAENSNNDSANEVERVLRKSGSNNARRASIFVHG